MGPGYRLWTTIWHSLLLTSRWADLRRRHGSTRRLSFETCETRCVLDALPVAFPVVFPGLEANAVGEPSVFECSPVSEQPVEIAAGEARRSNRPEGCQRETDAEEGLQAVADELDSSPNMDWNALGAGPPAIPLSAMWEDSNGSSPNESSAQPARPLAPEENLREAVMPDETARAAQAAGLPSAGALRPMASPFPADTGLEHERREWTNSTVVRYPLHGGGSSPESRSAGPRSAAASSPAFLDVGRALTLPVASLRFGSIPPSPGDLLLWGAANGPQDAGLRAENPASSPMSRPAMPVAVPAKPPSLCGASRVQGMMLLGSTETDARQCPLPRPRVPSEIPTKARFESTPGAVTIQPADIPTAAVGPTSAAADVVHGSAPATDSPAETQARRSTIEGIALLAVLASQLLGASRRPSRRTRPHALSDPSLTDSQPANAGHIGEFPERSHQ